MSKYFLIHGYGKALDLAEPTIPTNGGFYSFDREIHSGEAYPFVWSLEYPRHWWTPWSVYHQWKLYRLEQQYVESHQLHKRLIQQLIDTQPRVIIAHSMGTKLLHNALKYNSQALPSSVKYIVLCQADLIQWDVCIKGVQVISMHCWWDLSLWCSTLLSGTIPLGLMESPKSRTQDCFRGLYHGYNLHKDIWKDQKYKCDLITFVKE